MLHLCKAGEASKEEKLLLGPVLPLQHMLSDTHSATYMASLVQENSKVRRPSLASFRYSRDVHN